MKPARSRPLDGRRWKSRCWPRVRHRHLLSVKQGDTVTGTVAHIATEERHTSTPSFAHAWRVYSGPGTRSLRPRGRRPPSASTRKKLTARERSSCSLPTAVRGRSVYRWFVREGRSTARPPVTVKCVQGRDGRRLRAGTFGACGTLGKVEGDKIVDLIDRGIRMRFRSLGYSGFGRRLHPEGDAVALAQYGRIFPRRCESSGLVPQDFDHPGDPAPVVPCISQPPTFYRHDARELAHVRDSSGRRQRNDRREARRARGATIHNFQSGVAHHMADTEEEAIDYVRSLAGLPALV